MAYIGVSPVDIQTTIISGAQNTATLPLANPTFVTAFISGATLEYSSDQFLRGLPDPAGLETQADYNIWVFEAFNSQHSLVDMTEPPVPVDGELYFDLISEELKVYSSIHASFLNTQKGPFERLEAKVDTISGTVDDAMPLTGGTISADPTQNTPNSDGTLVLRQDILGTGGRLTLQSNDGSNNYTSTLKLFNSGGIDMAGTLSLTGSGASATIRAYGNATGVKQLNLATGDSTSSSTGVSTRLRLASTGVTIFSTDLILDTTGAGTAGIQAKGSSGQDVWSLSSDGQFNTPNTIPLKFNTGNSTSQIVAYNGSNAGLDFAVNTSAAGAGTATSLLTLDRTGAVFNSSKSNNFTAFTLNGPGIHWYQGAGTHNLYLETVPNASSQSLTIISKDIQNQAATDTLFVMSATQTTRHADFYTDYVGLNSPCRGITFSNGNSTNAIAFTGLSEFKIGAGAISNFDNIVTYLKFKNEIVEVGTDSQRIDTKTHGFVTLETPIAANASGNWFKLKGTAGGVEDSDVLRVKQNSGSDSNIEYFGSTSGGNSIQTKTSIVSNIQTSKLTFYDTINYYDTTPITFFPNTSVGQQFILLGGTVNQTLTFKHTGASQSASAAGNNMFSISGEGCQVSTGNLSFNNINNTGQFIKFGTGASKSFYIAKEDFNGHQYPGFAMNPANIPDGTGVYFPQQTFFGLTGNSTLDARANTSTSKPQVTIKGLGTNQNLITFEANSTSLARNQYIMFGGSGDQSSFGTYQIARGTSTSPAPSLSTDVYVRFRCAPTGSIQTDFIAPVTMPSSVAADNPHTRGEFDTVMTALKAAVNSSTDHASLKAALLSALAAY